MTSRKAQKDASGLVAENADGKVISRRIMLKVLAGGAVGTAAVNPKGTLLAADAIHCAVRNPARLAGMPAAEGFVPRFFDAGQFRTLGCLCEKLIPADEHSPGAIAAGVPGYIDLILLAADDDKKRIWTEGLADVDQESERKFARRFADCSEAQQEELLLGISAHED